MKKVLMVIMVLIMVAFMATSVYATDTENKFAPSADFYNQGDVASGIKNTSKSVWKTITRLVQIGAVACVVFAGLRYMFAAPSQKADIKQGLIYLTIGAVLVFGATLVISLISSAGQTVLK